MSLFTSQTWFCMACGREQFSPPPNAYGAHYKTCSEDCHDEMSLRVACSTMGRPYLPWTSNGKRPPVGERLTPLELSALRHIIHTQSPLEDTVGGLLRTVPQSFFQGPKKLDFDLLAKKLGEWTPEDGLPCRQFIGGEG